MFNIYAQSIMTATRSNVVGPQDTRTPRAAGTGRRWLPKGHWWVNRAYRKSSDQI